MLIRRTIPAMAVTLAVYTAAASGMSWLRGHLLPPHHLTNALDATKVEQLFINSQGEMDVRGEVNLPGAWVVSNRTITPTGPVFTGPANPQFCGRGVGGPRSCLDWVGALGLRQDITYQPPSRFWPLQLTETGLLLVVSLLLVGFCFWWTRRRLA